MATQKTFLYWATFVLGLVGTHVSAGEPMKPKKVDGHWSVLSVTITFKGSDKERKGLLVGTADKIDSVYYSPHRFKYSDGEMTDGEAWLDTLDCIQETTDGGRKLVFKDGKSRSVEYGKEGSRCVILIRDNDSREAIDLEKVKEIKFGTPARKDAEGNGMFDHWVYSPFTGEKLPPIKMEKK